MYTHLRLICASIMAPSYWRPLSLALFAASILARSDAYSGHVAWHPICRRGGTQSLQHKMIGMSAPVQQPFKFATLDHLRYVRLDALAVFVLLGRGINPLVVIPYIRGK